jgi:hypothetical protein
LILPQPSPERERVISNGDPFFFVMNNGKQTKAQRLRERLKHRPDDDFKVAMIQAIQKLEDMPHANRDEALSLVSMAITFQDRNDGVRARLALYFSGVLVSDPVAHQLWAAISGAAQPVKN